MDDEHPHWHRVTTTMYTYDDHIQVLLEPSGRWRLFRDGVGAERTHESGFDAMREAQQE